MSNVNHTSKYGSCASLWGGGLTPGRGHDAVTTRGGSDSVLPVARSLNVTPDGPRPVKFGWGQELRNHSERRPNHVRAAGG